MANLGTEVPRGNTGTLGKHRAFTCTAYSEDHPTIDCMFQVWGKEVCPTTQRVHWQGYIYFANPRVERAVRRLLAPHHVEIARGTVQQNVDYCTKDGNATTIGDQPSQGARTDLKALRDKIMNGTSVEELLCDDPYLFHTYGRTLLALEDVYAAKLRRTQMTQGTWIHGPTGVGKSHRAWQIAGDRSVYEWVPDNGWWDGYTGQDVVIMNEFRGQVPYNELLSLVDKWPYSVRRRNRKPRAFTSTLVIITCSMPPDECYHHLAETDSLAQLYRRFDVELLQTRAIST